MAKQFKDPPRDTSFVKGFLLPWLICLLAALFYSYDFFLRVSPSVMIHPLMKDLHIRAAAIGFISAFYYYAYTPMQIPSGIVVDKYKRKMILVMSVMLCVVGTLIFASASSFWMISLGRLLMGAGSAFAFVGALKLAGIWLPKNQFALFSGVTTALGTLGAVFADTILSHLVEVVGWRNASYVVAAVGAVLGLMILLIVKERPPWKKRPRSKQDWSSKIRQLIGLLGNHHFWTVSIVGCILFVPVNVFASLWGVAFVIQHYKLPETHGAMVTSLLFIGVVVGSPIMGWVSDYIKSRRIPIIIGSLFTLVLSLVIIYMPTLTIVALLILLFLMGFFTSSQVLIFPLAREISPPHTTGMATAAANFVVTIGAAVLQPLIGYLLDLNTGQEIVKNGVPIYSSHDYRLSFMIIPILLFISFCLSFILPKTECHRLYASVKDYHKGDD